MTRWKLTIEYDGTRYVGWQRQDNGRAVQQAVEEAVQAFCGETAAVHGAGRTDAGVHALGQVAHVDLARPADANRVREALNAHLMREAISVLHVEPVDDDFHARFSATERHYLYRILTRRPPPALDAGRVWHVSTALDADAMHDAAQELVGKHDFTSFRASLCQAKSPLKTMAMISVARRAEEIHLELRAPSFLRNQVRIIAGSLRKVGEGKWRARDIKRALEACERNAAGPTAPPDGLYLVGVRYDPDDS